MDEQRGYGSLAAVLDDVAAGRFPPADGGVMIVPVPSRRDAGVIGFTAHAVIFIDADPKWVSARLPDDLAGPLSPAFLQALCEHTGRQAHTIDMLCTATARPASRGADPWAWPCPSAAGSGAAVPQRRPGLACRWGHPAARPRYC